VHHVLAARREHQPRRAGDATERWSPGSTSTGGWRAGTAWPSNPRFSAMRSPRLQRRRL